MADHQAATASRNTGTQSNARGPQPFNGFPRPTGVVEDVNSQGPGQSLASGAASWIWGGAKGASAIGSALGPTPTAGSERRGPTNDENNFLHPPSNAFDGKQGSSSLLPGSGEHDGWNKPSTVGWSAESTSPALATISLNSQDIARSPVRVRGGVKYDSPKQSTEIPRSASPFYQMARQGAVGHPPNLSQSPGNKGYLDPASANSFGEALDFQTNARGRPLEIGSFGAQRFASSAVGGSADGNDRRHLDAILGTAIDPDDASHLRRGRGLSNSRGLAPPGAEMLGASVRSESLPPQHRASSSPPIYANQSPPDGTGFASYTHVPTSNPGSYAAHPTQGRFDLSRETREAELTAKLKQMTVDEEDQFGGRQRLPYSTFSPTPPITSAPVSYPAQPFGEYPYQPRHGMQSSAHGASLWSSTDDGVYRQEPYSAEQFLEGSYPEGFTERIRQFDRSGAMSPPENGDYNNRRNIGSPYYPSGGTPPSGLDSYRSPSRGGAASRTPQSGGYSGLQPDKLRQQLLVTQQQQQQRGAPHLMSELYRFSAPYNIQSQFDYPQNGVRVPMQQYTGSISPMVAPTHPASTRRNPEEYGNLRSMLLEDFRSNNKSSKRFELKDIYNHVVEFSGDQHGSRFIQQKLETANSDEKEIVFNEIKPNSLQLMTDVFGNYVIQKFFEHGNQVQKGILAKQMEGHVLTLSLQMYGCRVVQKALEHILTDQQAALVKELDGHVLKCVKDQNGNHVVQKAIERVPAEYIQFIINSFYGQVHTLATHPYGCRVIQRMLEHCEEKAKSTLLQELHLCTQQLVMDQYGNYVTQHVIEQGKPEDQAKIISLVTTNLLQFSKHKFASNVVEKSIAYGNEEQKHEIVKTVTTPRSDGTSPLQLLMRDQYGNYVIQKLLTLLTGADRETLIEQIKPQLQALKKFAYGKQINAIEKLIYHNNSAAPSQTASPPPGSALATPPMLTMDAPSPESPTAPSSNLSTTCEGPNLDLKYQTPGDGVKIAT